MQSISFCGITEHAREYHGLRCRKLGAEVRSLKCAGMAAKRIERMLQSAGGHLRYRIVHQYQLAGIKSSSMLFPTVRQFALTLSVAATQGCPFSSEYSARVFYADPVRDGVSV